MDEIPEVDRQRLEDMVQAYRSSIYNLYRMAYMQGQIEADNDTVAKLKVPA